MKRWAMLLAIPPLIGVTGCESIGRLPGIDPTDYAYHTFLCYSSQIYKQTVPQVYGSLIEAMADLGYYEVHCERDGEIIIINARTVDGRKALITLKPRNTMAMIVVKIGDLGDEMVAQALLQRVSLNFGEQPRTIIPMEPVLSRRIDPIRSRWNPMAGDPLNGGGMMDVSLPDEAAPPSAGEAPSPFASPPAPLTTMPSNLPGTPLPE